MRRVRTQRRGFTLAELLIVIAIIVVLMAIALPVFNGAREKARQSRCMANLHDMGMAIRMFRMEQGAYPGPYDPVSGQWGLNELYPTYITSRQTFICPDDPIQDAAGYLAQTGPGVETFEILKAYPPYPVTWTGEDYTNEYDTIWPAYKRTYEELITIAGQMYWDQPAFFGQHYSSYNNFYNYLGYAWWPMKENLQSPGHWLETAWERCGLLDYENISQPMAKGENIAAIYMWYRWDPNDLLNLGYSIDHPSDPSSLCYPNFECVDRQLHINLAQQVYWNQYADNPQGTERLTDDLGRQLWDYSESTGSRAWNTLPDGQPSAVFPGLINRSAPDNTIITRCPHHRAWTKTRLPSQRREKRPREETEPGAGQEGRGGFAYQQPVVTGKDFVLRLDGSVQMVPVLGGYNWAKQSQLTH